MVALALFSASWLALAVVDLLLKDIGFGIAYAVLALMWIGLTAAFVTPSGERALCRAMTAKRPDR